jgi:hypothetical protein
MRSSLWAYPWDIQNVGFDAAVAELKGTVDGVSLATSYHAGRFVQPRSPGGKVYFPEDGTIYFAPDPSLWESSRLKPQVSTVVGRGDVLRELCDSRERSGLAVNAWTVCLHNSRLGLLHPGASTQTAFGDVNTFSLCPSNPDARDYAAALVEDLTRTYRPDSVELETASFMPFAHGFHHEKDGVGLTAEDDFLLSLCFCPSCLSRAAQAGVDGEAARAAVVRLVTADLERPIPAPRWPDFATRGPASINVPEIAEYATWRSEPVTSLVAEIRERADPASKVYVVDGVNGWVCGCDHGALATVSDGLILCAYDMTPEAVAAAIARGRAAAGPGRYLGAGLRVIYPEIPEAADLAAKAKAAVSAGADGINFYCYGLIPKARLDWVRGAVAAAK